jgi:Saccharopine dehydrogenase NADP binding domain
MTKVFILGGYGNFGKRIARLLTQQNLSVIIAGRNAAKAKTLVETLPQTLSEIAIFDVHKELAENLTRLKPAVVINTCGPFQTSDYIIAEICIAHGIHYIDLADARDFVTGIAALDESARKHNVSVIAGASTVPGLSSAVVEHFKSQFAVIENMRFGITPGQKAERGLATTQAILGYVGKKLKPCAGSPVRYGWQDLHIQTYPQLGRRLMANCDIPDLDLLPAKYGIQKIQFSAGMESTAVHLGIWAMSWLIRLGLPLNLSKHASALLRFSNYFDVLGTSNGGMHVILSGKDHFGEAITREWFIIAKDGDGPFIPTIPAVIIAKKLLDGTFKQRGAMPCVGLIRLEDYLTELKQFKVTTYEPEK